MMQAATDNRSGLWTTGGLWTDGAPGCGQSGRRGVGNPGAGVWTVRAPGVRTVAGGQSGCRPVYQVAANGLSVGTISRPSGKSDTGISLKLAMPNGMPMIVTHWATPATT